MNDNAQDISHRIKELEGAVRKARIEAMKLAATLLTKENALLAGTRASPNHPDHKGDLAALRARYEGLVRMADDTQATLARGERAHQPRSSGSDHNNVKMLWHVRE